MARAHGMTRTPLLVLFNQEGEEISRLKGRVSREEILLVFKEAEIVLKEIEGENGEMYGAY